MTSSQAVETALLQFIKQLMQQNGPQVSIGKCLNEQQVVVVRIDTKDILPWENYAMLWM